MPGLIGYPSMWLHQQQVFEAVKAGQHVLVATGTGSGKTESFLYPIIDDLLRQRDKGIHEGLTAILVYPMNALANDQLDRLRDMLGGTGITFGQWVGTTPATEERSRRWTASRAPGVQPTSPPASSGGTRPRPRTGPCVPWPRPRSAAPRRTSASGKPRILLTNFRQLEILTTRLPDVALFAEAPLRYLVFDEAHTYGGATGAEVACLIRRVRALAGKDRRRDHLHRHVGHPVRPHQEGPGQRRDGPPLRLPVLRRRCQQGQARRRVLRQPGMAPAAVPPDRSPRRRHGPA